MCGFGVRVFLKAEASPPPIWPPAACGWIAQGERVEPNLRPKLRLGIVSSLRAQTAACAASPLWL